MGKGTRKQEKTPENLTATLQAAPPTATDASRQNPATRSAFPPRASRGLLTATKVTISSWGWGRELGDHVLAAQGTCRRGHGGQTMQPEVLSPDEVGRSGTLPGGSDPGAPGGGHAHLLQPARGIPTGHSFRSPPLPTLQSCPCPPPALRPPCPPRRRDAHPALIPRVSDFPQRFSLALHRRKLVPGHSSLHSPTFQASGPTAPRNDLDRLRQVSSRYTESPGLSNLLASLPAVCGLGRALSASLLTRMDGWVRGQACSLRPPAPRHLPGAHSPPSSVLH